MGNTPMPVFMPNVSISPPEDERYALYRIDWIDLNQASAELRREALKTITQSIITVVSHFKDEIKAEFRHQLEI